MLLLFASVLVSLAVNKNAGLVLNQWLLNSSYGPTGLLL